MASKIVTVYQNNPTRYGIPNVLAAVVLNDVETGRVEAVMEGSQITAMRTGAVSGVATKYLARTNAHRLGIFGAGVQGRKQFQAVKEVREIRSVTVYDTRNEMTTDFITEATTTGDAEQAPRNVKRQGNISRISPLSPAQHSGSSAEKK